MFAFANAGLKVRLLLIFFVEFVVDFVVGANSLSKMTISSV